MIPALCKNRQRYVGAAGECLACDAEHGEACRHSAEGRKPDGAPAGQAAPPEGQPPAGGEPAREAQ